MSISSRFWAAWRWLQGRLINATVLILSLTLTSLALEGVTRVIYHDVSSAGDGRSYFSVRGARQNPPQLNRFGFRERDFATSAPDETYRIAVIGDSFIEGQGIRDADRLTNLLERYLNSNGTERKFEVLNFGIRGSDTDDHINILQNVVLSTSPQFVLLGWFVNDVRNDRDFRWSSIPLIPWRRAHGFALRNSALYYIIDQLWIDLQHRISWIESESEFLDNHFSDPKSRRAQRAEMLLRRFIELCRNHNIPMGIVIFPLLRRDQSNQFVLGFLLDRVLQVCAEHKITCIDLRSAFEAVDVEALWVNQFDHHPNQLANHLAAQAVVGTFETFWTASAIK
jgi:lysophospholipase L1-like esterase